MKAGKIWGSTELIHANGVLEFHRIEFKKGFKCSEHEHRYKWNDSMLNLARCLSVFGKMIQGLVDETIPKQEILHRLNQAKYISLKD